MRKILFVLLFVLFLLAACSATVRPVVEKDGRAVTFLSLFPESEYVEMEYAGPAVDTIKDVVRQECGPVTIPDAFTRATYVHKVATLAAYVDENKTIFCVASKLNTDAFTITKGDPATVANGTLVTVNGEPIILDDVRFVASQLSPELRNTTTVGSIINNLVDERLLRQKAKDIVVTDEVLKTAIEDSWRSAGFTDEAAFRQTLQKNNISYESFVTAATDQLKVQTLLRQQGITDVNVTADDARRFYLNNPNSFLVSEQVRFRQLFIAFKDDKTAAQARLQNALELAKTDFCGAVRTYSDDTSSVESCGEYLAPRGVLLPSLEASIFSLGVNQSTVVESPNGYHVIVVLAHQPTSVIPYAQAEEQVIGLLTDAVLQQRLSIYLLKLRADAAIVDYTQ